MAAYMEKLTTERTDRSELFLRPHQIVLNLSIAERERKRERERERFQFNVFLYVLYYCIKS